MVSDILHTLELTPRDVLEFSVLIEEKGYLLYNNISKFVQNPKTKDVFSIFANEEIKHSEVFRKMILESSKEVYEQTPVPEHIQYLNAHISMTMFSKTILSEKLKRIKNVESAFEFLISMELDQILFYSEIRESLPVKHRSLIDEIIDVERRHFVRVMQIKQMKDY